MHFHCSLIMMPLRGAATRGEIMLMCRFAFCCKLTKCSYYSEKMSYILVLFVFCVCTDN